MGKGLGQENKNGINLSHFLRASASSPHFLQPHPAICIQGPHRNAARAMLARSPLFVRATSLRSVVTRSPSLLCLANGRSIPLAARCSRRRHVSALPERAPTCAPHLPI